MVTQRGIEGRFRHLLNDLVELIPHSKKEAKIEKKQAKV
jgi:ribosome biogenesis protein BRX1